MAEPLLSVQGLTTRFDSDRGPVRALADVSFDVSPGETVALVGESGSGKSVTALSILGLVVKPGMVESGRILFRGRDLRSLPESELRKVRGKEISMIFQEPMTSLNPVYTVGSQIVEVIRLHEQVPRRAAKERAVELLQKVGIAGPRERADLYPHQLSGGMRQRVMIAMALACGPALLIADEPTTALDVSVQADVLELLRRLQGELGMSVLFITHDLGVVAEMASRVVVLYAGRVMETGTVAALLSRPRHPYTTGLLGSVPPEGSSRMGDRPRRLTAIPGIVPDLAALPAGCRFAPRCALRLSGPPGSERCTTAEPGLVNLGPGASSRCHFAEGAP
ncbi:MAG TPA: ABC transporter ATP-binding protein [Polyangiaceae bacterium]|nr:ABC transporter ATP-binding protein [Polyangiaceae bacterium]